MASNYQNHDSIDANPFGRMAAREECEGRPIAPQVVERDAKEYNMNHPKRGKCIIFYFSKFDNHLCLGSRDCAPHDASKVKAAFTTLEFDVESHHNLTLLQFRNILFKERKADHSTHDCLAVVFMSHGNYDESEGIQWLYAYDERFRVEELFHNFAGERCLSLAGKPKLFFMQACRGENTDRGVMLQKALRVNIDMLSARPGSPAAYSISSFADTLRMWASYPGFYAFKTKNNGINGSVFIHFLCKVLNEEGTKENLSSLLLRVTREVTVEFESRMLIENMDRNKQIPYMESTLIRHMYFKPKES